MFQVLREFDDSYWSPDFKAHKTLPHACEDAVCMSRAHHGRVVVVSLSESYRIVATFKAGKRVSLTQEIPT